MTVTNPHDRFFRQVFGDVALAAEFLAHYLPASLAQRLDLTTLAPLAGSFVDEALQQHHSDLLFSVNVREGEAVRLYLLFEHKSQVEKAVVLQLLRYMLRIWEGMLRAGESLVPIVPLVFYHGERPWTAPVRLGELMAQVPGGFEVYVPDYSYLLTDLSGYADEGLVGSALLRGVLLAFRHVFGDLSEILAEVLRLVWEEPAAERRRAFVRVVLRYSAAGGRLEQAAIERALAAALPAGEETNMSNWLEELIEEGREEGARRQLLRFLRHRYGEVPTALSQRLERLQLAQLEQLTDAALETQDLDAFARYLAEIDEAAQ